MLDFHWFSDPNAWGALLTLTLLEIVLGIDNIIFISILVDRLKESERKLGRMVGLGLAMLARLGLLASISWIMGLKNDLFVVPVHPAFWDMLHDAEKSGGMLGISIKDLILIVGGLFLIWKSTKEIHHKLESADDDHGAGSTKQATLAGVLTQIILIDLVFSLDSVITAVGMVNDPTRVSLMMVAVLISVGVMMLSSAAISSFVSRHPSIKILALSFLILIGTTLLAEGIGFHVPKGYIYFAMTFSLIVEMINLRVRRSSPVPAP